MGVSDRTSCIDLDQIDRSCDLPGNRHGHSGPGGWFAIMMTEAGTLDCRVSCTSRTQPIAPPTRCRMVPSTSAQRTRTTASQRASGGTLIRPKETAHGRALSRSIADPRADAAALRRTATVPPIMTNSTGPIREGREKTPKRLPIGGVQSSDNLHPIKAAPKALAAHSGEIRTT